MFIIRYKKIFYAISVLFVVLSFASMVMFGFRFGIDFTGGSIIEVFYAGERPSPEVLQQKLAQESFAGYSLREAGENGYLLRTPFLSNDAHTEALKVLSNGGKSPATELRFNSIGPSIGGEIKTKAVLSISLVILAIVLFITFAFRKVSEPVSSWKYGLIAIVALLHDVIIPTGFFTMLGALKGVEIDALFVTALLVILGFSIHDTIVVFDRVRENLRVNRESRVNEDFDTTVGKSIAQTFNRSINTSLTTILALLALYFLGSEVTQNFSLALIVGIIAGTYSSIFLASPLLTEAAKFRK